MLLVLLFATTCNALAAGRQRLSGHVPAAVGTAPMLGRLPADTRLNLAFGLPLRNRDSLARLIQQLYDPADPQFHHFLTPGEFTAAFGPTDADYQAVIAFARSNHLTVTATHPNRTVLDVSGSVADIERAFHITMRSYQHPRESRNFFAPDAEPSLDLSVPVLHICGLDNYEPPHPASLHHTDAAANAIPQTGSGPGGTFIGNDFRAAYVPGVTLNGSGQSVALLEFDGYYASDISSYESQAGLPSVPLSNVLLDGFNGAPTSDANTVGEVSLDIEMAVSMAPGLSHVYVYEAGPNGIALDILNRMASDNTCKQISSSWTWSPFDPATEQTFLQFQSQGQSYFNASGDSGAYTGTVPTPSDDTNITSVGATTLSTSGPGGPWVAEMVWNWFTTGLGSAASSGGISTAYQIPYWQQGISMSGNQGSTSMRNLPDVALTGDNVYVIYDNGSTGDFGGTSCAAPLWAGFTALVNQQAVAAGHSTVGFLNPALYNIGKGPGYTADFHDTTTGANTNTSTTTRFFAVPGYDLCTGWGTPNGSNLINTLAPPAHAPFLLACSSTVMAEGCLPTNGVVDPGETVTVNFLLENIGTANTTNLTATLLSGGGVTSPSGSQNYGALSPGATAGRSFSFTASGVCGGILTATLQLTDGAASLGSVSFTIRLGAFTPATTFMQNFDGVTAPALPSGWSTATSGSGVAWVTSTSKSDTAPNAAFVSGPGSVGSSQLISPIIPLVSTSARLTFRNNYNFQASSRSSTGDDGGVLEISIGGGAFMDILDAGGWFSSGGYNRTISSTRGSPLAGRLAWSGNAGGFILTTVNLPPGAAGQNIQLRWNCGTDSSTSSTGWYIDSITLTDGYYACCSSSTADLAIGQIAVPNPVAVSNNLTYTLALTNFGPANAASVTLTDALPANVSFVSASPGLSFASGNVTGAIPLLAPGATTNYSIVVKPTAAGTLTNSVSVSSATSDLNSANNTALLTVAADAPPAIALQPTNQTVVRGVTVTLQSGASGTGPLGYQWYFNATNTVAGATNNALTLTNIQSSQAGGYDLVVTNPVGAATSSVAQITVLVPPSIAPQPTNQTIIQGATVTLQSGASGTGPLNYQWYFNSTNAIGGATNNALTLTNIQSSQAGPYNLIVTNVAGSATSAVAQITVLVPPSIAPQPTNQTVVQGATVTLQSGASGSSPLNYQWYFNGTNLPGATTNSLTLATIQPSQAGPYNLIVTNAAGAATSMVAQITVLAPPSIAPQPTNQTVIQGATVTLQSGASGSDPLSYQWYFNGTNLPGAITNTLTLTNIQSSQAGGYNLIVTNVAGFATSAVAQITVLVPPSIAPQPTNQTVIQGATVTLQSGASGSDPLSYQWYFNGTNLPGAITNTLTLTNIQSSQAGGYNLIVTNVAGADTSMVAQIIVLVPPSITLQPTNQVVLPGGTVSFQSGADGSAPLSYQWFFNGTNVAPSTTNFITLSNVQPGQAGGYYLVVSNAAGSTNSATGQLVVLVSPSVAGASFKAGVFSVSFTSVSGISYTLEYKNTFFDPVWTPIAPALSGTGGVITLQDTNAASAARYYRILCQ